MLQSRRIPSHPPRSRGFVLIAVLGILSLLALLAVAFVSFARTEAQTSHGYVDDVRARMLAIAGMEYAVASMRTATLAKAYDDPKDPWVYKNTAGTEVGAGLSFVKATPSFNAGIASGFKYSGSLGGTYRTDGDLFILKILDSASQIYLNGSQPTLWRILDDLGRAIEQEAAKYGRTGVTDPIRGRGDKIIETRDAAGGFGSKRGLFMVPGFTQTDFETLRDYVCVEAWVDSTTVTPTGAMSAENLPLVKITPRSPVNLNTAPRAVLQAVIAGISSPVASLDFALAGKVADEIIAFRELRNANPDDIMQGPFVNWHQFYDFVDGLTQAPTNLLTPAQAEVLKVHSNPNYTINALNPEAHVHHMVDKASFATPTTEFTFRSMGYYEITSLGRLLGPDGVPVAETQVRSVARLYEQYIHTTQDDFVQSRKSTFDDNTAVIPNSMSDLPPDQGSKVSGHVQLFTQALRVAAPAVLTFQQDFNRGYTAYAGDGTALAMATDKDAGVTPDAGSDEFQDGAYTTNRFWEHLAYTSAALPSDEGTLEMWVKFDEQSDTQLQPFFFGTNRYTSEAGLQCILRAALVNGDLYLEATRTFYCTGDPAAYPVPFANTKVETKVRIPKWGQMGEWHHVALEWFDGTDHRLFVDGARADLMAGAVVARVTNAPPPPGGAPVAPSTGEAPYDDLFYLGGQLESPGVLRCKNLTLDDVRIYNDPLTYPVAGFPPNDRFEHADPVYVGLYSGQFPTPPVGSRLGTLAWTEWLPKEYDGVPIAGLENGIEFDLGADVVHGNSDSGDHDHDGKGAGKVIGKLLKKANGGKRNSVPVSDLGIPTVVVAGTEVIYTFEFVIPVGLLPLNMTPIVDDIYLMYQGPVRYISFEISED